MEEPAMFCRGRNGLCRLTWSNSRYGKGEIGKNTAHDVLPYHEQLGSLIADKATLTRSMVQLIAYTIARARLSGDAMRDSHDDPDVSSYDSIIANAQIEVNQKFKARSLAWCFTLKFPYL